MSKTERIEFRVSAEEKADFLERAEAAGVGLSEYVRAMALSNPTMVFHRRRAEQATEVGHQSVTDPPAPLDAERAREAQEVEETRREQEEINRARRARTLKQRKL